MEKFRLYGATTEEESQREREHRALARRAAAEGMVLLKNDGVLPFAEKNIALYGAGARMTVRGGTGSGDMQERSNVTIEQGLLNAGFTFPSTRWMDRFLQQYHLENDAWRASVEEKIKGYGPFSTQRMFDEVIHVNHLRFPIGDRIAEEDLADGVSTAIYVVARQAGESADRKLEKGDFLLSDVETENIRLLSERYEKILLVINSGGLVDLSCLDEIPRIGAVLYFGQGGMEGGNAFADVVSGKVTPSGKLSDTWGKRYGDYPAADAFSYLNCDLSNEDYIEGVFVGYRYFDAFGVEPRFPFGFGLSYTTFSCRVMEVHVERTTVTICFWVENTGTRSGREVVQAYLEKPSGKLVHERRSLAAFVKTKLLSPGESTPLTLSFDLRDQAAFDAETACWYLEAGMYGICVGTSSRENEPAAVVVLESELVTERTENICPQARRFTELIPSRFQKTYDASLPRFALQPDEVVCVHHTYQTPAAECSDKIKAIMDTLSDKELVELSVGAGYTGRSFNNTPGCAGRTTVNLLKNNIPNITFADGPAGLNVTPRIVITKSGSPRYIGGLPEAWRWGYLKKIERLVTAKPSQGRPVYQYMTAWPNATLLAQTWDTSLLEKIGRAVGTEMIEIGVTLWLAPGMNIHRNPLCGRNFEYYSEDPLLSGKMAAALTRGVQSHKGVGTTIKHFCCNNQEDRREYVSENLSERALRQIYLKGFQIAVSESDPLALMSSYNLVNGEYVVNSHDLLTKVLRCEWGYTGLVMSDWNATGGDKGRHGLCPHAGNDLIMPGNSGVKKELLAGMKDGTVSREDIRRGAVRVLNIIFNSAVVEGF